MVHLFKPVAQKNTERQKFYLSLQPLVLTEGRENLQRRGKRRVGREMIPEKLKETENYCSQQRQDSFYYHLFISWSYLSTIFKHQFSVLRGSQATFLLNVELLYSFHQCILNAMAITLQYINQVPENTSEGLYCLHFFIFQDNMQRYLGFCLINYTSNYCPRPPKH